MWHVVGVNSKMELEVAKRIRKAGFIAHCPEYLKNIRAGRKPGVISEPKKLPLFSGYLFVAENAAFRKDIFETSRVRLTVFRKSLVSDGVMAMVNLTAAKLSAQQSETIEPLNIKRGDIMKIINGITAGKIVKAIKVNGNKVDVEFEDYPGRVVEVPADTLGPVDVGVSRAALGKAI